mmetsp:Transcript_5719/g.16354  ORF Transcript_5719/g.16354 Transcript_5719/m.16354 type:complete len:106 (-) Transcript_5719:481-798(-)
MEGYMHEQLQVCEDLDELAPFFIGYNKVLLCRPSYQREYFQLMIAGERSGRHVEGYVDPEGFNARKVGTYFGYPVAIHARGYLATFAANDDYSSQERGGGVTETK